MDQVKFTEVMENVLVSGGLEIQKVSGCGPLDYEKKKAERKS